MSDLLASYSSLLKLPYYKKILTEEELREGFSYNHFLAFLAEILGQFLGVTILGLTAHNYVLVALLNALTFFISTILVGLVLRRLGPSAGFSGSKRKVLSEHWKELFVLTHQVLGKISGFISVKRLLLALMIQFSLTGAENALLAIYFLNHPLGQLSYEQTLLALQLITSLGMIVGDLSANDWVSRQSYPALLAIHAILMACFGFFSFIGYRGYFLLLILFLTSYVFAKASPKLSSLLLIELPEEYYGQVISALSTFSQLAIPLGSLVLTSILVWNQGLAWLLYFFLALISLVLLYHKNLFFLGNRRDRAD